ncbi:MAG: T9SS type A sorting domain-containing protein [Bacteroidota bacterium]
MKKLNIASLMIALALLAGTTVIAQINVDPGLGTLDQAIKDNGAGTYVLQAGMWYGLNEIVEINDAIEIIGEETDGLPAIIQIGNNASGEIFPWMFRTFADFTLKNLFLTAQDFEGTPGPGVIEISAPVRMVVDNCVIDPAGVNYTFGGMNLANGSKLYVTNSEIYRNGHLDTPNDGGWLQGQQWDTLYLENNTWVSSGQDLIARGFDLMPNNKFIWINHNTFIWHDVWIKKSYNDQDMFFTNNLMHDISLYAQFYAWGQFFPDYQQGNYMLSLTCIDTLVTEGISETLPSDRKVFWEYNLQYNSPATLELINYAKNEHSTDLYFIPMLWDDDTPDYYTSEPVVSPADSSRENRILNDDTNWPYMKYANNWYDIDPGYTDSRIYDLSDSAGLFLQGFYGDVFFGGAGDGSGHPSYYWDIDDWNGVEPNEFPVTWPRFDGTYTNAELLTASIEGLPLGDLNWFPDEMAQWEADKADIMAHILDLNEDRFGADAVENTMLEARFSVYPNPASSVLNISSELALSHVFIYDVTGRMVEQFQMNGKLQREIGISQLSIGVYFIEAETLSGDSFTSKFLKK